MRVIDIVEEYLCNHWYDGLCSEGCGCKIGDLMPCGEDASKCVPGYEVPCPGSDECPLDGDCAFHISPKWLPKQT